MIKRLPPGCLHGQVLRRVEVAGLILTERAHGAGSRLPPHAHETAHYCYVLRGGHTERHAGREVDCRSAALAFRGAGETHANQFHDRANRVLVVELTGPWQERLRDLAVRSGPPASLLGAETRRLMASLHRELYRGDTAAQVAIEGLALELIAETARGGTPAPGPGAPRWLRDARDYLDAHFAARWDLGTLARRLGVHPVHLASAFRRHYGCPVGEYIRRRRVEHARLRLAAADAPALTTVALEAGFADQSHFCKTFKRLTGLTPSEYRNRRDV